LKVFIYEYICGGGLAGTPLPDSLAREGWAMLASIVEDFSRIDGCEVVTTLDERFAGGSLSASWVNRISANGESPPRDAERRVIERFAADCEWALIIAPEFDGILFDRVTWVERAGGRLLGSSSRAVSMATDKFTCGQLLQRAGVPAVSGRLIRIADGLPADCTFPAVLKPRDGAGSQSTFLVLDAEALDSCLRELQATGIGGEFLLQPFVDGKPVSVSFLVGLTGPLPLLAGEQRLSLDGRFRYSGGRLPLPPAESERAIALASRAVAAVPGLNGFVGVDLVLAHADSDHGTRYSVLSTHGTDIVIEINPRLTTSYVGLRRLARENLAERMLQVASGELTEPIAWHLGTVRFSADGQVTYSAADPGNAS
jgi:predicted ATP-grasp superfamily ATP-dependent carboligase